MSRDGYAVDIMIGLRAIDIAALLAAGQPIPPPLRARALLDTGSDRTAVALKLLQHLGIVSLGWVETHTAGGVMQVDLYPVSLSVPSPAEVIDAALAKPEWVVTEFLHAPPDVDALIGLDLAEKWLLILDGPGQRFTLGF
jgi:hypothetical protein